MTITRIEMHQNHLFYRDKYSRNDVSHLIFNMMIKKGFGANNEGILWINLYITETNPYSNIRHHVMTLIIKYDLCSCK